MTAPTAPTSVSRRLQSGPTTSRHLDPTAALRTLFALGLLAVGVVATDRAAWADGGQGGEGPAGGVDSPTGAGGTGGDGGFNAGGGGGGSGLTGGNGGAGGTVPADPTDAGNPGNPGGDGGGTPGNSGKNGLNGADETNGATSGGGGGGGAHGTVGAALPTTAAQGGNGGDGGSAILNGMATSGAGGGGGAGGYGAVVTGNAGGTLGVTVTGGDGGYAGLSGNGVASAGSGGVGLYFTSGATGANVTIGAAVTGGNGGNGAPPGDTGGGAGPGGAGIVGSGLSLTVSPGITVAGGKGGTGAFVGTGGAGITGSNLAVTNAGTITGGLANGGAAGAAQADAVLFTGGTNSFTITSTSTVHGNVVAASAADTFGLGGNTAAPFNLVQLGGPGSAAQYQGFGILQKSGASTWTVIGTPGMPLAYQVTAGTLNLGTDQRATSLLLTGGTLAGGTLTVYTTTGGFNVQAGTISANLAGSGALTKTTTGTVILSGNDTYNNSTFVNAGTLEVDGSLQSVSLVGAGGTLSGTGVLAGTAVSGTLSPGNAANPYGTLTVNGSLSFGAGSFYNVAITPTQNSRTNVVGPTTIQGGTVNVAPGAGTYSPAMRYTILTAAEGVTGTFAGVTTTTPLAFLTPRLSYDADDVYLNFQVSSPVTSNSGRPVPNYTTAAVTQNQRDVAQGLTNAGIDSNGRGQVLRALNQLTVPQAQAAFNALSGEGIIAAQNVAFRSAQLFNSSIFDQTTFYGNNTANSVTLTAPPIRELADLPTQQFQPVAPAAPTRTWRAWATGWGGEEHISGNAFPIGSASQNNSIYGGTLGVDYQLTPNYLIGVAVGGSNGIFQVDQRGTSGTTTGGHIAIYDLYELGPWYGASSNSFSYYGNQTTRYVAGFGGLGSESERGNFNSDEFRTRLEIGRHFSSLPAFAGLPGLSGFGTVTPFIALEIAELRSNGFTETPLKDGPGLFRLNVSGQTAASAPGSIGLRFQRITPLGNGMVLSPTLQLAYVHEFAPYRPQIGQLASLPGSTFLVDGARPARDAAQVKAGAELALGPHSALFANFEGEFSGVDQLYAGKGGFRYTW